MQYPVLIALIALILQKQLWKAELGVQKGTVLMGEFVDSLSWKMWLENDLTSPDQRVLNFCMGFTRQKYVYIWNMQRALSIHWANYIFAALMILQIL